MIMQLSAILQPILQAGVQFGTQFLNRELGRDARRAQKDLLKAQARASAGGGSFTQSQSPGTVSAPFLPQPAQLVAGPQRILPGMRPGGPFGFGGFGQQRGMLFDPTAFQAGTTGPMAPANGAVGFATSFQQRFVLDKESGCLRQKMPGDKGPTFRIDRETGDFVRVKPRRINPFNKSAARRASRRIDATINAMADLVRVSKKRDKGKSVGDGQIVRFRTRKRKKTA